MWGAQRVDHDVTPSFEGSPLAAMREFQRDVLGFMRGQWEQHGDVVYVRGPMVDLYIVSDPEHLQQVLVRGTDLYVKDTRGYRNLRMLLGNGLVTSEGDFWKRQRRIANPAFHRKRLELLGDSMVKATQDMLQGWEPTTARRGRLDVASEMMRLTLRIVGETLMSVDVTGEEARVGEAVGVCLEQFIKETMGLPIPLFVKTPSRKRFEQARAVLDDVVGGIIAERRRDDADRGDLLSMLMAIQDEETGERMDDLQLRDEVMTMFLAGHETTAMALTWTLHLLSRHPGERRRVEAELAEVLGGRAPTVADLPRLELLDRVIRESMRLIPPVPVVARSPLQEDWLGPHRIPPGAYVLMSMHIIHRHPRYWENPDAFDPDRFLPERFTGAVRKAWLPFIIGPRKCIGERFAMMEAALVLATVLQRVRLDTAPGVEPVPDVSVTLRPRHGLPMDLSPR